MNFTEFTQSIEETLGTTPTRSTTEMTYWRFGNGHYLNIENSPRGLYVCGKIPSWDRGFAAWVQGETKLMVSPQSRITIGEAFKFAEKIKSAPAP